MFLQRKYVDLIRHVCSKWVNLDPPIPIQVGSYGEIERDTGEFRIEGSIYDKEFQDELDRLGIALCIKDHMPQEGGTEEDMIIASSGARRIAADLGPQVGFAGIINATLQGQWEFEQGKRDALLLMHCPRMRFIPNDFSHEDLFKVPKLRGKRLVTNIHICPAFSMYLSNKSGEKVSFALVGQVPVPAAPGVSAGGQAGLSWWSDSQAELLRRAADKTGNYCFTPLYTVKRPYSWVQRLFRQGEEEGGEKFAWDESTPPWDPLNEEGEEDSLDVDNIETPTTADDDF